MKILGLDLGEKTLGIAISNSDRTIALMKETFRFNKDDYNAALNKVIEFTKKEKISEIALGYPLLLSGEIGERDAITLEFKKMLSEKLKDIKVVLVDERMTSVMSEKLMISMGYSRTKRKARSDSMAAVNILSSYLDKLRNLK